MNKGIPEHINYKNRIKLAVCIVISIAIFTVKVSPTSTSTIDSTYFEPERVGPAITLVEITRQPLAAAQPERPSVRLDPDVLVDDIFEPEIDVITRFVAESQFDVIPSVEQEGSEARFVESPQTPPRVARIVEPVTPAFVFETNQRYRVLVRFLISEIGAVEEVFIVEVQLWDQPSATFNTIQSSQPEIVEATMQAAVQWQFRPAIDGEEAVKSFSTHIFTFGR